MPLPAPPFRIRAEVFASSAFLLLISAGLAALMGWSVTTMVPREARALMHERVVWDRGVTSAGGSYEGKEKVDRFVFHSYAAALEGVSDSDAKLLEQAFGIRTIRDFGTNKFSRGAVAIVAAAELEG